MGLTHCICRDGEVSQGPRGPEDLPRTKALFYFPTAEYDVHAEVVSKELPGQWLAQALNAAEVTVDQ